MHHVIAIDGPAASGKSSVARALAQRLGFDYVNSGALYRALTWHVLQSGVPINNPAAIARLAGATRIQLNDSRVLVDATDATGHLRDDAVNGAVSLISQVPRVRDAVNGLLRGYARERDAVIEGRDIGSAVFPHASFKFYIDASPEVRLERRAAQGEHDAIAARDELDARRSIAPLVIAPDADVIDTSALSIDQVVEEILRCLERKGLAKAG
jgi:cytidylate kinase